MYLAGERRPAWGSGPFHAAVLVCGAIQTAVVHFNHRRSIDILLKMFSINDLTFGR
jgi:hypothetical protein